VSAEYALQMAAKMVVTKKSSETVIFPWRGRGVGGNGGKVVFVGGEGVVVKCGKW